MADKELSLLNKVDLRIALAETDSQLENSLKLYLCPVILKLASDHKDVRQAVFTMLQNIMTRVNSARDLQLPVAGLLNQAKDPKVGQNVDASNVILYSLLFSLKGIERLTAEGKRELVPTVLHGISKFQTNGQKGRIFNIFVKLVGGWKAPEHESMDYHELIKDYDFEHHKEDKQFLVHWVSKFLFLQPVDTSVQAAPSAQPGLSSSDVAFFTIDAGVKYATPQQVSQVKKDLLEVLKVGFEKSDLRIPLLIASSDTSSVTKDYGEIMYRKLNVDLEDQSYVSELVGLFVGDAKTPAVGSVLQEKILSSLTKSVIATNHPDISKVTTLGLESTNRRLKQTTIEFVKWISVNNENSNEATASMNQFNTDMARKLKETILNEGWPKVTIEQGKSYNSIVSHRQTQYEALCSILKTTPDLIFDDFTYLEFLFESLEGEDIDMRPSLQEGLSSLVVFLPQCSDIVKQLIKSFGQRYLQSDNSANENIHSSRFVILKFINCTFPFDDCEARYLNVLGTAKTNRPETIEEATKGLHPHWFNVNQSSNTLEFKSTLELLGQGNEVKFPEFKELISFFDTQVKEANDSMSPGDQVIFQSMGKAIEFCVQTSIMQAIKGSKTVVVPDEDWSVRLEKAFEVDEKVRKLLTKEISKDGDPFKTLLLMIFDAFERQFHGTQDITFESTFVRLLSLSSSELVGSLSHLVDPLLRIIDDRILADLTLSQLSRSVGIISSHPQSSDDHLTSLLNKLISVDLPSHKLKANILVTAYIISRLAFRNRIGVLQTVNTTAYFDKVLSCLKEQASYNVALECIGELALYGVLGPQLTFITPGFITEIVDLLKPKIKKCDERSVLVLSYLNQAVSRDFREESDGITILDKLTDYERLVYDTHISKQTEYLFTSGETFSILAVGWKSKVLNRAVDIQDCEIHHVPEIDRLPVLLEMVLSSCANTKPALRRAGCIWLLSIVEYCNEASDLIKQQSSKIHLTFMKFLGDRDELVQEAASRGLSLVYELGDVELKDSLVKGLLKSFTDQNSGTGMISGTVDQDTELFDSDVLRTHDGSVSTYRDVLNLASDVGDPSLVYKFMSLAKSSALWSSRKGMAFGLGSILSKTGLDEMLAKNKTLADRLIPKLYRYKYDPVTSVSNSMQDIWNVLVDDSSKTIKAYFKSILKELLAGMGNKEWRVRQASTTALNDLLNVVDFHTFEGDLPEIWNMSFRIMDDIKDSVRKEGNKVTKLLARVLINNKQEGAGVGELIPFLLGNKGLLSDAEDIRSFALDTILKLIKSDSKTVKKYVPTLLDSFIGLMSTLEPEVINYLILNADKYNLKNNDIDAKRLQSLGHSPMMEAIDRLIDQLDYEIMGESVDAIVSSIKKSIGLPSKVCGSRVLVSLINKKYELTKPYGEKLFKIAVNQIKDKNDTISSSYSISVGYLSRLASLESIVQYGKRLQKMYFESEDNERERLIASVASGNFSKYSNEKFESVASEFLPLTFIGMNDINKDIAKNFEKQWIETTSGSNVLKLYLNEIIDMMSQYIMSPNYQVRQNLARSIVKLTNDINDFSNLPSELIEKMFEILLESCKGKSWSGKELILEALVNYSIKLKSFLQGNNLVDKINKVVLVEGKRRNKEYQKHSIQLVGKYLHHFPPEANTDEYELMDVYVDIMQQILDDEYEDSDDEDMDEEPKKKRNNNTNSKLEEQKIAYITNLFDSFTGDHPDTQLFELMDKSLSKLLSDGNKFEITWRSKVCGNELFTKVVDQLQKEFRTKELLQLYQKLYSACSSSNNIENVKIRLIRTSKSFVKYLENVHYLEEVSKINDMLQVFDNESTVVRAELEK